LKGHSFFAALKNKFFPPAEQGTMSMEEWERLQSEKIDWPAVMKNTFFGAVILTGGYFTFKVLNEGKTFFKGLKK
jgi:hypothetical protein